MICNRNQTLAVAWSSWIPAFAGMTRGVFRDAVASVVEYARGAGKPLVIEQLDFRQKKAVLEGESRKYSRSFSSRYFLRG